MSILDLDRGTRRFVCDLAEDIFEVLDARYPAAGSRRCVREAVLHGIVKMFETGTRDAEALSAFGLAEGVRAVAQLRDG